MGAYASTDRNAVQSRCRSTTNAAAARISGRSRGRIVFALLLASIVTACSPESVTNESTTVESTIDLSDPLLQAGPAHVHAESSGNGTRVIIPVTYTNRSAKSVFYSDNTDCTGAGPGYYLEHKEGSTWRAAHVPICSAQSRRGLEIKPGEVRSDTIRIDPSDSSRAFPVLDITDPRREYRIVYMLYSSYPAPGGVPQPGELLPLAARVSGSFELPSPAVPSEPR